MHGFWHPKGKRRGLIALLLSLLQSEFDFFLLFFFSKIFDIRAKDEVEFDLKKEVISEFGIKQELISFENRTK